MRELFGEYDETWRFVNPSRVPRSRLEGGSVDVTELAKGMPEVGCACEDKGDGG